VYGGFLQTGDQTVALRDLSLSIAEAPATITTIAARAAAQDDLAHAILAFLSLTSGQILYRGMMSRD